MGLTLAKLFDYFDAAALVEGSTKIKCRTAMRKLTAWRRTTHGDMEAGSIAMHEVGAWQLWMAEQGLRRTSIPGYVNAVSQVYTWAIGAELLTDNPFLRAKKMRAPAPEVVTFSADELEDLIEAAGIVESGDLSARLRWSAMILLGAGSGPRAGEIWNLRWEDIDLEAEIAHIRYHPNIPGECWEWGSKTMRPRIIPLSQQAVEVYYRLAEVATWRYPHLKEETCKRRQALVGSLTERQRKRPYPNFYEEFKRIRQYADGMRRIKGRPPIRPGACHRIRKTAITDWLRNGTSIADAQCVAGHASKTTTLVYYTAVHENEAVENIRKKINAKRAETLV